jgi:hypothetical protein
MRPPRLAKTQIARTAISITLAVLATSILVAAAEADDAQVKSTVRQGFNEMTAAYKQVHACHGCTWAADIAASTALRWMANVNRARASTPRGEQARTAAYKAFCNYELSADSTGRAFLQLRTGLSELAPDEARRATAHYQTAQKHAKRAAILLGLGSYP